MTFNKMDDLEHISATLYKKLKLNIVTGIIMTKTMGKTLQFFFLVKDNLNCLIMYANQILKCVFVYYYQLNFGILMQILILNLIMFN